MGSLDAAPLGHAPLRGIRLIGSWPQLAVPIRAAAARGLWRGAASNGCTGSGRNRSGCQVRRPFAAPVTLGVKQAAAYFDRSDIRVAGRTPGCCAAPEDHSDDATRRRPRQKHPGTIPPRY